MCWWLHQSEREGTSEREGEIIFGHNGVAIWCRIGIETFGKYNPVWQCHFGEMVEGRGSRNRGRLPIFI